MRCPICGSKECCGGELSEELNRLREKKPLTDEEIKSIMLENGFTIKEGLDDLKPYVYAAARAIEKKIWEKNG